ncbi:hypothetical protein PRIPAC_86768, partial [Pristionchus pacificus]
KMKSILVIFALIFSFGYASIDFTSSTMYDINDFLHKDEVPIAKCDNGCLIYASTMGSGFDQSPSGWDPYSENLIIHDRTNGENLTSITDLSRLYNDKSLQKTPLIITGPASISVVNLNDKLQSSPIAVYVVQKAAADKITYGIYDVINMNPEVIVNGGITTVMCAEPIRLTANSNGSPNSVTARLVGFDNALDGNVDECPVAYSTTKQALSFTVYVDGPIVSLSFAEKVGITARMQFIPSFDLAYPGFITSGGWNGCKKPASGGLQSFRSLFVNTDAVYLLTSQTDKYNVSMDIEPNLDKKNAITVYDLINRRDEEVFGYEKKALQFDNTSNFNIIFSGLKGDQGFLLRYSAVVLPRPITTAAPTTTSQTSTSTALTPTTTSGSSRLESMLLTLAALVVAGLI